MYRCQPCKYKTNNYKHYCKHRGKKDHYLKTGDILKRYAHYCATCNIYFNKKSLLEYHKKRKKHKTRIDPFKKKYYCNICDYWTYNNNNYNVHKHSHKKKNEIKKTIFKATEENIKALKEDDICNDINILKSNIQNLLLNLNMYKIDPNDHFNYKYYALQAIDNTLTLDEYNHFYQELKRLLNN